MDKMMQLAASTVPHWAGLGRDGIRNLNTLFGSYRGFQAAHVVIKCGLAGIAALRACREVWPDVPFLIIIRDPGEVIVSSIDKPPKTLVEWYTGAAPCPFGIAPSEVVDSGLHELSAWAIGRMFEEVLRHIDDRCLVLDYRDLTPETTMRVAEHFGLQVPPARHGAFSGVFAFHAKRPGQVFSNEEEKKRRSAAELIVGAANRWASAAYEALLGSGVRLYGPARG